MPLITVRIVVISVGVIAALGAWLNFYILRKLWQVIIKQDVRIAAIGKLVESLDLPEIGGRSADGAPETRTTEQRKAIETLQRIGSSDMEEARQVLHLLHYIKNPS
jgi:hypothetical protein